MTPLYHIMHHWMTTPFVWGESDCCLGLADWYHHLYGIDPAKQLRGQYHDAQSCQRLCKWFTDPVSVISNCLDTVGGRPFVDAPERGDVGVITVASEGRTMPAGAVWLGDCWGCKGPHGATTISGQSANHLAIWGIGYAG